jgi:hypothetical protein
VFQHTSGGAIDIGPIEFLELFNPGLLLKGLLPLEPVLFGVDATMME